jgi:hypothetical protein
MYSFPPAESYGPLHFYLFQFSYTGVLAISRICCDLGLPVRFQIPLYYCLQTGVCMAVVYGTAARLVPNLRARCAVIALAGVALWDGVFLWGGPLGFSLGCCALTLATYLTSRQAAEPQRLASGQITLLILFSLCCHPFMLPFALLLCGVRFLFDARRRTVTIVIALVTLAFGLVILRDSPRSEVGSAAAGLKLLFGFNVHQVAARLQGLFVRDDLFIQVLFGGVPISVGILFGILSVIHVAGFCASPVLACSRREPVWLRMLAALDAAAFVLYVFSWDVPTSPVGDWPQRLLTTYAPITYLVGCIALLRSIRWLIRRRGTGVLAQGRAAWVLPGALVVLVACTHYQIFRYGRALGATIADAKSQLLSSGVENAYVVVSGVDKISPFMFRCVPFALFSDPDIVAKHIAISTEWHTQARHPSRVLEGMLDLGRKRYLAEFSVSQARLMVNLKEHTEPTFPTPEHTNESYWLTPAARAENEYSMGKEQLERGLYASALQHFNSAVELLPNSAEPWNDAGVALYKAGQYEYACRYFAEALKRDATSVDTQINLALAYMHSGRNDEALQTTLRVLEKHPENERARILKAQLSSGK